MLYILSRFCQVGSHLLFFVFPMSNILFSKIFIFRSFIFKINYIQSKFWVPVNYEISNILMFAFIDEDCKELPSIGKTFGVKDFLSKLSKFTLCLVLDVDFENLTCI
jgi:hypothetical protein